MAGDPTPLGLLFAARLHEDFLDVLKVDAASLMLGEECGHGSFGRVFRATLNEKPVCAKVCDAISTLSLSRQQPHSLRYLFVGIPLSG